MSSTITSTLNTLNAGGCSENVASKQNSQLSFLRLPSEKANAPLLIYFPGLDETGQDLISLEMADFKQDFDVSGLIIPTDDLDDWDSLTAATIALVRDEIAQRSDGLPVCLCAESFGGCLALKVLEQAPDLFDRIVLINPASSLQRVPWLAMGVQLMPLVPELFFHQPSDWLVFFLAPPNRISNQAYQALAASTRAAPKKTLVKRLNLMQTFSLQADRLRRVKAPVLLVGSQCDRILPSVEEVQRLTTLFPNSQVVTLPHSGHACLTEREINLDEIMRDKGLL